MNEDEAIMHMIVQVLGADGITVTMELGQLIGLQRLLHAEREQLTGRPGFILLAEVGEDGSSRAVGWRWAGEEETMEWLSLPFATLPEPEGHED
jgi:hypothetical protein